MDMQTYYDQFENCMQEEKAFCSDDCPFHMDVIDFEDKLAAGRYSAAFKILRNAVVFPEIVTRICPQYCTRKCPRNELGGSIQINKLERTCLVNTKRKDPNKYNLPARKGRIAIIGAGLAGLSCALRLASKKYETVIYEKTSSMGGQLIDMLPEEVITEDINRQFKYEKYILITDTEISDIDTLTAEGFDAVFVATGNGGNDFGVFSCKDAANGIYGYVIENTPAVCHGTTAVYAGGSLLGKDVLHAAADGLAMAKEIEGFIKTGIFRYPQEAEKTKVEVDASNLKAVPAVGSAGSKSNIGKDETFNEDEMKAEISRCIRCQCNACKTHCDLTAYFDKWPLQMRDDIMATTMPANSMIRKAPATRLINMCTQCGLCGEVCPGQIELGSMIKEARRMMHKIGRMPDAFHQFWVRDMEFANSKYASLAKCPPGKNSCSFALFPGCHLGAADPAYVEKAYKALLTVNDDTGLILRCCGVPADWAGNEEVHSAQLDSMRADWEALGKPTMIMACPSCMRHFREYMPEIPIVSIYEVFDMWNIPVAEKGSRNVRRADNVWSIFDPCAARNCDDMQDAVRKMLAKTGIAFEELPGGDKHGCCGFGGNIEVASSKMAKKVAGERSALSENPYITYCINCRDVFHDEGKPVTHALNVFLDIDEPGDTLPTVTERRCNRVILKEQLLNEIWGESMNEKPVQKYNLIIRPEIETKMNSLKILEEDICHVIEMGELHGRRVFDPAAETYKCYREIGSITCWVEYKPVGDAFELVNVYTHRMKIELEVVFNGRKTDFDLR